MKKVKDVKALKKIATRWFNEFIRLRDAEDGWARCISSGRPIQLNSAQYQAGHYIPATCENLRYNEDNVHAQSKSDNYFKSGNLVEYRKNLIKKIGLERVEKLEMLQEYYKAHGHRWDAFSLQQIIETYQKKVKQLRK